MVPPLAEDLQKRGACYMCMHHRRMAKAFSCCHATTLHTHCMCAACQLHTQCMRKATYTVVRGLGCALLCLSVCLVLTTAR